MLNLLKDNIILNDEAEQDPRTYHRRQEQEETGTTEEDIDLLSLPLFTKPLEKESSNVAQDTTPRTRSRRAETVEQVTRADDEEDILAELRSQFHLFSIHNEDQTAQSYRSNEDAEETPTSGADPDSEEISTKDALTTAPDKGKFREGSIRHY